MKKVEKAMMFVYREKNGKEEFFVLDRKAGDKVVLTGHVEKGERPKETAIREVKEEIEVEPIKVTDLKVKSTVILESDSKISTEYSFLVKIPNQDVKYLNGKEKHLWCSINELEETLSYPNQKKSLSKIRKLFLI